MIQSMTRQFCRAELLRQEEREMNDIKSMNLEELQAGCEALGEKPFRAKQLYEWIHQKMVSSYD